MLWKQNLQITFDVWWPHGYIHAVCFTNKKSELVCYLLYFRIFQLFSYFHTLGFLVGSHSHNNQFQLRFFNVSWMLPFAKRQLLFGCCSFLLSPIISLDEDGIIPIEQFWWGEDSYWIHGQMEVRKYFFQLKWVNLGIWCHNSELCPHHTCLDYCN